MAASLSSDLQFDQIVQNHIEKAIKNNYCRYNSTKQMFKLLKPNARKGFMRFTIRPNQQNQ